MLALNLSILAAIPPTAHVILICSANESDTSQRLTQLALAAVLHLIYNLTAINLCNYKDLCHGISHSSTQLLNLLNSSCVYYAVVGYGYGSAESRSHSNEMAIN